MYRNRPIESSKPNIAKLRVLGGIDGLEVVLSNLSSKLELAIMQVDSRGALNLTIPVRYIRNNIHHA